MGLIKTEDQYIQEINNILADIRNIVGIDMLGHNKSILNYLLIQDMLQLKVDYINCKSDISKQLIKNQMYSIYEKLTNI